MIDVIREKIENMYDCHSYMYIIKEENKIIKFYQAGSGDLIMIFNSNDLSNRIRIDRSNYPLYKIIDKLYKNVMNVKRYKKYRYISDKEKEYLLKDLVINNNIVWKSDVTIGDNINSYNYLIIKFINNIYELEFKSDLNLKTIAVEFNTDRSRYMAFVFDFYDLLKNFEVITEPYRQIELNEYFEFIKVLKKEKIK